MKNICLTLLLFGSSVFAQGPVDLNGRPMINVGAVTSTISTVNSSTATLGISGVFTGTSEDAKDYAAVTINAFADVASAANGLSIQWSSNGTNWDHVETYDIAAGVGRSIDASVRARYFRIIYTNGATGQATFRLQSILQTTAPAPRKEPLDNQVANDEAAIFTRSAIVGKTTAGGGAFIDVKVTPSGTLTVDGSGSTQPVSGTLTAVTTITNPVTVTDGAGALNVIVDSSALPTGASTSALQDGIVRDGAGDTTQANVVTGRLSVDGSGVTQPVSGTVTANAGTGTFVVGDGAGALNVIVDSGTTVVTQGTAANLNAAVVGTGTAGAAAGGVLTIQGVAAMTKLLVTPDSVALPANQSVNVAQLAGTTTDTNSGVKSAGTLRVVLATDQPALTNKLLVTPDSVALPANQSVNLAQVGGAATSTAASGVAKVGIVGNAGAAVDAVEGAAPPANRLAVGGITSGATGGFIGGITVCTEQAVINTSTATTTLVITGVSGRHWRICSLNLVVGAAQGVAFITGTGATCGTSTAAVNGGTTGATGWQFAANGGLTQGSGIGEIMSSKVSGGATGDSLCIVTSTTAQTSGNVSYAIW